MSQTAQFVCDRCGNSIYNTFIDNVRIPIIAYTVFGQVPDSGEMIDVNAPGVKLPLEARALMDPRLGAEARLDECIACYCETRGITPVEYNEKTQLWLFERPALDAEAEKALTQRDKSMLAKRPAMAAIAKSLGKKIPAVPARATGRAKELHGAVMKLASGAPHVEQP